jgi:hypothetical protein
MNLKLSDNLRHVITGDNHRFNYKPSMLTTCNPLSGIETLAERLRVFDQTVRQEIPALLRHYQAVDFSGRICYVDQPGRPYRVRPWCDALEISMAFGDIPQARTAADWISAFRGFQDPVSGLVPEYIFESRKLNPPPAAKPEFEERYNTMIVNYVLEGLGSSLAHPVANAENINPDHLVQTLKSLDWANSAWGSGAWVDCYASCLYPNKKYFGLGREIDCLFTWLDTHADPETGLWGQWRKQDRWLQPVNGFYRLTRGTYAQFGRPLPYAERAIDTILLHAADPAFFSAGRGTACNVLDVVHPLWLCLQQTTHRREEAKQWIHDRLPFVLQRWETGRGLAFDFYDTGAGIYPGLKAPKCGSASST